MRFVLVKDIYYHWIGYVVENFLNLTVKEENAMSVEIYSTCVIRHRLDNQRNQDFMKSLIELRQHDVGHYSLRAIDLEQNKKEIFDVSLTRRDQYQFHPQVNHADRFDTPFGLYLIVLNRDTRDMFHYVLRTCLENFLIVDEGASTTPVTTWEKLQRSQSLMNELAQQADQAYYRNDDPFECLICNSQVKKDEGILFRHCLHPCCRDCVLQLIQASTEPTVKCPHDECTMLIEERELRGVVKDLGADEKTVDRLLDTGVRFFEARNKTVHCLTPDCQGFWILEPHDENSLVYCEACKRWICLACKAIHGGQTCKEYQEMKLKETNEANARTDAEHLQALLNNKQIMQCPGCKALLEKMSGCDWLQCLQCKLEICWPTRGPRWGPGGRGDTSGGCRCRVNGVLCVPNCGNCH